jgi:hypothetical protein
MNPLFDKAKRLEEFVELAYSSKGECVLTGSRGFAVVQ